MGADIKKKDNGNTKKSLFNQLVERGKRLYFYCVDGVWSDPGTGWKINVIKTLNLSVNTFLNKDIQSTACAMAFRTLLATVPALALLFAIGRGFGFANLMRDSLLVHFPAQRTAIEAGLKFVDSYLNQASEGIFVGVGILFLLWTLISLVSSAENALNQIWGVVHGRTLWRKITDYTAIFLILPILMICSTGINVMMSTTLQTLLPFEFMTPLISGLLDSAGVVLTWGFFTGVYMLLPNTKVKFRNAIIAGILSGTAFTVLQWLFVTGQVYVSKYNAIYGSFSFLPLLMLWLQLVWVITFAGGVVCYSSQNIFRYSFATQISKISFDYRRKILISVLTIIAKNYKNGTTPPDSRKIAIDYAFPMGLVGEILEELTNAGLVMKVFVNEKTQEFGYVPAIDLSDLTVGLVIRRLRSTGVSGFIPGFGTHFQQIISVIDNINESSYRIGDDVLIVQLKIDQEPIAKKNNEPIV